MKSRASLALLAVAGALVLGLAWPWSEEVVPEWTVTVKLADGQAVPGVPVVQAWLHQTVQSTSSTEQRTTDSAGVVVFPPRRITISAGRLALGTLGTVLKYWFNASFGPHGQVIVGVEGPSNGCDRLVYSPGGAGRGRIRSECVVEAGYSIKGL